MSRARLGIFSLFASFALYLVGATCVEAGTKVQVGRLVASGSQVSIEQIDHSAWDRLLKKYVDANGLVDYKGWKRSSADVRALDAYLKSLSAAKPNARAGRNAKLAFWINAYNAITIKGILREYPTSSIRNHTARIWGYNIWHDLLLKVGGTDYSLDTIEHKILRKIGEPRIHFAIVCASMSCPKLRGEAYTAAGIDQQLTDNAKDFFRRSANFRYDTRNNKFHLSSILSWFADDFGSNQSARLREIAPYLPTAAAAQAANRNRVSISYLSYDWSLNEQSRTRSARR